MPDDPTKRIVFAASPELMASLEGTAGELGLSKIGTIRLAVAILTEIVQQASRGGRLILRDPEGRERELWLPQVAPRRPPFAG